MAMNDTQLKTWVEGFDNVLADGQEAERKLFVMAVNVGASSAKQWEVLGVGVEDSALEYNDDTETKTDILGVARTRVNKMEPSQEFEPDTIRGGAVLQKKLDSIVARNAYSEFTQFEVMVCKLWLKNEDGYYAEVHSGCTIKPTSMGGSAYVDMPFSVSLSNKKTYGTVTDITNITFTEATAA